MLKIISIISLFFLLSCLGLPDYQIHDVPNIMKRAKPCNRRKAVQTPTDEWVPTYSAQIVKPYGVQGQLKSASLKDEDNIKKGNVDEKIPQEDIKDLDNVGQKSPKPSLHSDYKIKEEDIPKDPALVDKVYKRYEISIDTTSEQTPDDYLEKSGKSINIFKNSDANLVDNGNAGKQSRDKDLVTENKPGRLISPDKITNSKTVEKDSDEDRKCIEELKETRRSNNNIQENVEPNGLLRDLPISDESNEQPDMRRAPAGYEQQIKDPAVGAGISTLSSSRVNLLQHGLVCYACSTLSNPTCWKPNERTTVKFCRRDQEACITKTFVTDSGKHVLVRDCGQSCSDSSPPYKSCSVCHKELCNDTNGAIRIYSHSLILAIFTAFIVKYSSYS